MTRAALLPVLTGIALLPLAACDTGGVDQADRQRTLTAARAGMDRVRALPGGKLAAFTEVRLVGGETVCGRIDGRDGFGPRPFASTAAAVTLADPRDAATGAAVDKACAGPSRTITSRNEQFSDLDVAP